ncbi:MAG: metalloregulator ArsR/SmtB family transcription factor [Thermoplasmatota archaeon]
MPTRAQTSRKGRSPIPQRERDVYAAIADPTRRAILALLATEDLSVGRIASNFDVSRPAISKHLAILKAAGLVTERSRGRERWYSMRYTPLAEVLAWVGEMEQFWTSRLASLGEHLDRM